MIYHITTKKDWEKSISQGFYSHASLAIENFIHASTARQVEATVNRYYAGQSDLVLLHIDENKLATPLKYELATSVNEEFPHIYGVININAVLEITDVLAKSDGLYKIDLG